MGVIESGWALTVIVLNRVTLICTEAGEVTSTVRALSAGK